MMTTMKIDISPDKYVKLMKDFKTIKSMKPSQFIQWVNSFYKQAYNQGRDDAFAEMVNCKDNIILPEDVEASVYTDEEMLELILSVKGIGINRANQLIELILRGNQNE